MTGIRRVLAGLLILLVSPFSVQGGRDPGLSVLFVFTFECRYCGPALSLVQEISTRHPVEGIAYGTMAEDLPGKLASAGVTFPVAAGDAAAKERYGVRAVPTAVLLSKDGRIRERLSGCHPVRGLEPVLEALSRGALGVHEVLAEPERFVGKEVAIAGRLTRSGGFGAGPPALVLSNGLEKVRVEFRSLREGGKPGKRPGWDEAPGGLLEKPVRAAGKVRKAGSGIVVEIRSVTPLREGGRAPRTGRDPGEKRRNPQGE